MECLSEQQCTKRVKVSCNGINVGQKLNPIKYIPTKEKLDNTGEWSET